MCLELADKWIKVYQIGNICIDCSLNMMRILLEDIITYRIGKRVSLLDIIHHGDPGNAMLIHWMGKRFPEFYPEKIEEYNAMIKRDLERHNRVGKSEKPVESSNIKCGYGFCSICEESVYNRIHVYPLPNLCIDCAQYTMKSMFEDIIEYYNEKPVSLLEIMCCGNSEIDMMKKKEIEWEEQLESLRKESIEKDRIFFDFDNAEDKSDK